MILSKNQILIISAGYFTLKLAAACLLALWKNISRICKGMMLMHEQTFVHSSDISAPHICWNNWVCTYSVVYWDTEAHTFTSKSYLQMVKREKKNLPEIMYI